MRMVEFLAMPSLQNLRRGWTAGRHSVICNYYILHNISVMHFGFKRFSIFVPVSSDWTLCLSWQRTLCGPRWMPYFCTFQRGDICIICCVLWVGVSEYVSVCLCKKDLCECLVFFCINLHYVTFLLEIFTPLNEGKTQILVQNVDKWNPFPFEPHHKCSGTN